MFDYFYHGSMRRLVVAFGSIFDEIYIRRVNPDGSDDRKLKVPITYGPKEKFYRKITELEQSGTRNAVETILPRMGFEITSMAYDTTRKMNSHNKSFKVRDEKDLSVVYSYSEVPYNVEFSLNIMTRNIEDGYQIVEQILPYFTPDFTVTMNFTDLDRRVDVPIVLSSISTSEEYEGDLTTRRLVTHTLNFVAKSYIFSPIRNAPLIKEINLTFRELMGEGEA
jgi:hypothetical protein